MKTKKLYHYKTYETKFNSTVISIEKDKDFFKVVLAETLFYPEGGGQPYDLGYINGCEVVNVQIKNDIIYHYIAGNINFETKDIVYGEIDWERRFEHMQCHTAEHIVTGMARKYYPCENIGFNISDNLVTIDLSVNLTEEEVKDLEIKCNDYIMGNTSVDIVYPTTDELKTLEYRAKLDLTENVRIVNVGDIDSCACCGLHCDTVREIALIKFISHKKNKGGTRIMCLAGKRALNDYIYKHSVFREVGDMLSSKEDEVLARIKKLYNDYSELKSREIELKNEIVKLELQNYDTNIYVKENLSNIELKNINLLLQEKNEVAFVISKCNDVVKYSIGSKTSDCRKILENISQKIDGKGGGKPELVQGSFFDKIDTVVEIIKSDFS